MIWDVLVIVAVGWLIGSAVCLFVSFIAMDDLINDGVTLAAIVSVIVFWPLYVIFYSVLLLIESTVYLYKHFEKAIHNANKRISSKVEDINRK